MKTIQNREVIGDWLTKRGLLGMVVEIGVMHGGFSRMVLNQWRGREYVMVDLWARQDPSVYKERTDDVPYDLKYLDCVQVAKEFPIVRMVRDFSVNAAKQFKDESLDWVFIDANHSFDAVTEDMDAWFPKLKKGGLFSGHDYMNNTTWPHFCEVKSAVDKWMLSKNLEFVTTPCSSWWTIKH